MDLPLLFRDLVPKCGIRLVNQRTPNEKAKEKEEEAKRLCNSQSASDFLLTSR